MSRMLSALFVLLLGPSVFADEIAWQRLKLDDEFVGEGVAAGDFNRDGAMDVAAGDYWYAAPDFKRHELRPAQKYFYDKGYSRAFCSWAYDINADGWQDVMIIGFPGAPCHWYENPRGQEGHWKEHEIWHSACNETVLFTDLTGDGKPELILGSQPERQMGYLPVPSPDKANEKWQFVPISEAGDPAKNGTFHFYHGLGTGDVNNDGRLDVIIGHGWWEAPEQRDSGLWEFHPHILNEKGEGNPLPCANIHAYDLDLDGDSDLMCSSAHSYGVWWYENVGGNEQPDFKYHLIDDKFSQTHALELADINGDGTKDLVTGKRFYAHQGHDPGGKEPVVMYWYEIKRQKGQPPEFVKHEMVGGRDTGIGTQFEVTDFDGDQLLDVVLSNKKGVNVLLQRRK